MATNDIEKIVSLAILTYYDGKIKTWVKNKISQQGITDITEEQIQNIVDGIVNQMIADGDIADQEKVQAMINDAIDASGVGISEEKAQQMIDTALQNHSLGEWGTW